MSLAAIFVQRIGRHGDAQAVLQDGDVEPGEVHQLHHAAVTQEPSEIGAIVAAPAERRRNELHQMGMTVAGGQLHQTEPVAMRVQTHRLGVDRHDRTQRQPIGQVMLMEMDGAARHELCTDH